MSPTELQAVLDQNGRIGTIVTVRDFLQNLELRAELQHAGYVVGDTLLGEQLGIGEPVEVLLEGYDGAEWVRGYVGLDRGHTAVVRANTPGTIGTDGRLVRRVKDPACSTYHHGPAASSPASSSASSSSSSPLPSTATTVGSPGRALEALRLLRRFYDGLRAREFSLSEATSALLAMGLDRCDVEALFMVFKEFAIEDAVRTATARWSHP